MSILEPTESQARLLEKVRVWFKNWESGFKIGPHPQWFSYSGAAGVGKGVAARMIVDMLNLDNRDKSEKYLNIIKSEIDRSLNVMNDFMEYSKIKVNKEICIGCGACQALVPEVFEIEDAKFQKLNGNNSYNKVFVSFKNSII